MLSESARISAVPTNIITGFLGVGKTSVISHLLKSKPAHERWAVLVNEFGEIGVDGAMLSGQESEGQHVFIREVPGGCMCCAAGLPMQIALNQLLVRAKPDRLLIEPSGLGHPKEVLQVLSTEHYQELLDIQKVITLVDARNLSDVRYTENDTFRQQIEIADLVVGNKTDLYEEADFLALEAFIAQMKIANSVSENEIHQVPELTFTQKGQIDIDSLEGATRTTVEKMHLHHDELSVPMAADAEIPSSGLLKAVNEGSGYHSVGWRFSPELHFDRRSIFTLLSGLNIERAKGVFITVEGVFAYNLNGDTLSEMELDDCLESRIEFIDRTEPKVSERDLMQCLAS